MIAIKDLVKCIRDRENAEAEDRFGTPRMNHAPFQIQSQTAAHHQKSMDTMIITAENILIDHNTSQEQINLHRHTATQYPTPPTPNLASNDAGDPIEWMTFNMNHSNAGSDPMQIIQYRNDDHLKLDLQTFSFNDASPERQNIPSEGQVSVSQHDHISEPQFSETEDLALHLERQNVEDRGR